MIRQTIGRLKTASKAITQSEFDALDLLRSDHMKLEGMLLQLRIIRNPEKRTQLFKKVRTKLEKHMRLEETVFYPACEQVGELFELVEHSFEEHVQIKQILKQMNDVSPGSQRFPKLVSKLIKHVEEHVFEEENRLFSKVRRYMNEAEFKRLSQEMIRAHNGKTAVRNRKKAA